MTMRKWIPLLVIVVAFAASAAVYSDLPERMPTHWNRTGEVDGWTPLPWGAFLLPVMLGVMLAIFYLLPKIDPRAPKFAKFRTTYEIVIVATMVFLLGVHLVILATALGRHVPVNRVMPIGVGILFMVIGNLFPRMRPNWVVGVRTPWTLASDRVWDRTHRFGGRVFVAAGVLVVAGSLFAPSLAYRFLIGCATAASLIAVVYSYVIWRNDPDARKNTAKRSATGR